MCVQLQEDGEAVVDDICSATRTSWQGQGAGAWPGGIGPRKAPHPAGAGAAVSENSERSLASL